MLDKKEENKMIDYKKKVEKICKEAGNQQWIY